MNKPSRTYFGARSQTSSDRLSVASAVLAIFGILILFCSSFSAVLFSLRETVASRGEIAATYRSIKAIESLIANIRSAESGQRGFLLTDDFAYLEDYRAALERVRGGFKSEDFTAADWENTLKLRQETDQKLAELALTVTLRQSGRGEEALRIVRSDHGLKLMREIEATGARLVEGYRVSLAKRSDANVRAVILLRRAIFASSGIALCCVLLSIWLIRKEFSRRSRIEHTLRENEAALESRVEERTAELREQAARLSDEVAGREIALENLRRAGRVLRQREQQLSMIFEDGAIGDWSWDIKADTVSAHDTVWRLYGAPERRGSGPAAWFRERQHPDDLESIDRNTSEALEGRAPLDMEFRLVWRDGSVHWLVCRGVVIRDAQGVPIQIRGLNIDVTERKLAELKVKESEQQFRDLTNAMPQIVWTADAKGHSDYHNDRWYEFMGVKPGDNLEEAWMAAFHPDDLQGVLKIWGECLQSSTPFQLEYRLWDRHRGEFRWFLARGIPVFDSRLQIARWLGTCTDIHEQKASREALEREVAARTEELNQSLSEKVTLLKEVHHRVKNNLQVISSLLRMQAESLSDRAAIEALRESQQRVMSMGLIHERLYGNEQMDQIDFGEYARALVEELVHSCSLTRSSVGRRFDVNPVMLSIDQAIPCGLILNELMTNALKHAYPEGHGGEIAVRLCQSVDGEVTLSVADQGVGIPPGFNWRNGKSLGLSIVEILTRQLGGKLMVNSRSGAMFTVQFMARPVERRAA